MSWRASVLTLYPEMFPGPLGHSLAGKAQERGIWLLEVLDIRASPQDRHRTDVLARAIDNATGPGD